MGRARVLARSWDAAFAACAPGDANSNATDNAHRDGEEMKSPSRIAGLARLFAVTGLFVAGVAAAQPYPSKAIRIIVPYPAGGTSDILARALGPGMTAALGQPVIVENKPGSTGNVGADLVAKSPADGYTLLLADIGSLAISPSIFPSLPFDPVKDFAPVVMVA